MGKTNGKSNGFNIAPEKLPKPHRKNIVFQPTTIFSGVNELNELLNFCGAYL